LAVGCGAPQPAGVRARAGRDPRCRCNSAGAPTGAGTLAADLGEVQPVDPATFHKEPGYFALRGPAAIRNGPYFGDEHVHTGWSAGRRRQRHVARARGGHAVRAREEVISTSGQPVKWASRSTGWPSRPLRRHGPWIAEIKGGNPEDDGRPTIKRWHDMLRVGQSRQRRR